MVQPVHVEWEANASNVGGTADVHVAPPSLFGTGVFCLSGDCQESKMVQSTVAPMPKMRARGSVTPSLAEVEEWLSRQPKRPRFVPIYREVMADT